MSTKKITNQEKLANLAFFMADAAMDSSDEEVMAAAGDKALPEVERIQRLIQNTIDVNNKDSLKKWREKFEAQRAQPLPRISGLSKDAKRVLISKLHSNESVKKKLTLAARSQTELSDNDLDVYLDNLRSLGIIDDEGNIL